MAAKVPYVDLAEQHRPIKAELLRAAEAVIDHGKFVFGPEVEEFEQRFAELCGVRHAIGVNSGTDALLLALRAIGVGPGDEVITPANSFIATASAVMLTGGVPVFTDIGADGNLDPERIEAAVTPRTKAILPVHLTGRPADMAPIREIAERRALHIVEDAAQAVLARYGGRAVGSLGDIGCFSLHPLKTLNACGDGGVLTTDYGDLANSLRMLRNLGQTERGTSVSWSGNSRLDSIQAAMLLVKLRYVREWTEARRRNAAHYRKRLDGVPGLVLPIADRPDEESVYHLFVLQSDRRNALKEHLHRQGVRTAIHYPVPIHLQPAARPLGYRSGDLPETERQARRILSIPVHADLTAEQLEHVVQSIRSFGEQEE